jgi:hypothetical protein
VNKTKISGVQLIESPVLCGSVHNHEPGYPMLAVKSVGVRCRQVFCRIDVEDGEQLLRAVVGVRAK